jgi:type I restriction enzyme S subunit
MPRANWEDIGNLPQVVPPRQEQRAIADFLDRETAKIDALIAAQERLIALLDEKRQATITHAVTKGLDPNAPMKESGVEWLGKVPAQWNIRPLRYVARFTAGAGFPDAEQGLASEELPFFKVKDLSSGVTTGKLYETDNTISRNTACRLHAKIFPEGTIVFAKIGAALLLNRFRIVGCNCCIDNNMMGMQCIPRVITPWFARMVMSLLDMRLLVNPGAVPSLSEGNLSSLKVAIPPLDEQRTIEEQLDYVLAKISHLRNRSETVIERLRERRTALITAAVTGQIDVTRQAITETAK